MTFHCNAIPHKRNYTSFLDYKIITAVQNIRWEHDTKGRQSWRLGSPGMWQCVTGCAVPHVTKVTQSFKMPGCTHQTQQHSPHDLAQQNCCERVKSQLQSLWLNVYSGGKILWHFLLPGLQAMYVSYAITWHGSQETLFNQQISESNITTSWFFKSYIPRENTCLFP